MIVFVLSRLFIAPMSLVTIPPRTRVVILCDTRKEVHTFGHIGDALRRNARQEFSVDVRSTPVIDPINSGQQFCLQLCLTLQTLELDKNSSTPNFRIIHGNAITAYTHSCIVSTLNFTEKHTECVFDNIVFTFNIAQAKSTSANEFVVFASTRDLL